MKSAYALIPTAAIILASTSALAADNEQRDDATYLGLKTQFLLKNTVDLQSSASGSGDQNLDLGFGAGVVVGNNYFGSNIRSELEYAYTKQYAGSARVGGTITQQDGSIVSHNILVNGYYDFDEEYYGFQPYLGAGVGFSFVENTNSANTVEDSDEAFIWQLSAGWNYDLESDYELFGGYRYLAGSDVTFQTAAGTNEFELEQHQLELGLRYRF